MNVSSYRNAVTGLYLCAEVQAAISATLPLEFSDVTLNIQNVIFKVHRVMLTQRVGAFSAIIHRWNKDRSTITLKSVDPNGVACVLLILYGLMGSALYQKFDESVVQRTWEFLYPGSSSKGIGPKQVFQLKNHASIDLMIRCKGNQKHAFAHCTYVAARSQKMKQALKNLIGKDHYLLFVEQYTNVQMDHILEYLYESQIISPVTFEDFKVHKLHARSFVDNPEEFLNLLLGKVISLGSKQTVLTQEEQLALSPLSFLPFPKIEIEKAVCFLENHPHIQEVDFRGTRIYENQLLRIPSRKVKLNKQCKNLSTFIRALCSIKPTADSIKVLTKTPCRFSDDYLRLLTKLYQRADSQQKRRLEKWVVASTNQVTQKKITGKGLRVLGELFGKRIRNLKMLNNPFMTREDAKYLCEAFPNLEHLGLNICQTEKCENNLADFVLHTHLPKLTKLCDLMIRGKPVHDLHMLADTLSRMKSLRVFTLENLPDPFDEDCLFPLTNLPFRIYFSKDIEISQRTRKLFDRSFKKDDELTHLNRVQARLLVERCDPETAKLVFHNCLIAYEGLAQEVIDEYMMCCKKKGISPLKKN